MYKRVLLTGAAGALGRYLRPELAKRWSLRASDVVPFEPLAGEEVVVADLADRQAVFRMVEGCDAILHFGAISIEATFDEIMGANIGGSYNIYEGARLAGVKRIVFASSNHAIGYYPREAKLDADSAPRPDTYYGVSKAFGEALGAMYYHKYGIEHAALRIGSCMPTPGDTRMLSTWLSYPDLLQLITRCLDVPRLGLTVLYGQSNNDRAWWDNSKASYVGFKPRDNAEDYAEELLAKAGPIDPEDPAVKYMGGVFCTTDRVPIWGKKK